MSLPLSQHLFEEKEEEENSVFPFDSPESQKFSVLVFEFWHKKRRTIAPWLRWSHTFPKENNCPLKLIPLPHIPESFLCIMVLLAFLSNPISSKPRNLTKNHHDPSIGWKNRVFQGHHQRQRIPQNLPPWGGQLPPSARNAWAFSTCPGDLRCGGKPRSKCHSEHFSWNG